MTTYGVGDLLGASQLANAHHYRTLGCEPRDLIRSADKMLFELSEKIGTVPGTDFKFFGTNPVDNAAYEAKLDLVAPAGGGPTSRIGRFVHGLIQAGARVLPS